MLHVEIKGSDGESRTFSFDKNSVMIGRAAGNDICLDEKGVSRYHARLSVEENNVIVQDLNSTNGTFVNALQIDRTSVAEEDKITIGDVMLSTRLDFSEGDAVNGSGSSASPLPPLADEMPEQVVDDEDTQDADYEAEEEAEATPLEPAPAPAANPSAGTEGDSLENDFYWSSLKNFLMPIWSYLIDDAVSEIMINGPEEIYIESKGAVSKTDASFTEAELKAAVLNIAQYVGRRVSEEEPYLDARLPDGSRVAVLMPPCSRKGVSIAIRKFSNESLTLDKLLEFGSLSAEMITFIEACVVLRKNIIISGGTSSGKTSLLNVVSCLIPKDERIITIEDSAELQLKQDHVVPMETRPPDKKGRGQITIRDLVKVSLRMRPDRIVVGEVRGGEALDLLQAMNTGHSGSMATVHASSPPQALTRLETLSLFSGLEIPVRALRDQVSSAVDVIIQASRLPDHSRKVTHISEVGKLTDDGQYQVRDIFRFDRSATTDGKIEGAHIWTGELPAILDEMALAGFSDGVDLFKKDTEA